MAADNIFSQSFYSFIIVFPLTDFNKPLYDIKRKINLCLGLVRRQEMGR